MRIGDNEKTYGPDGHTSPKTMMEMRPMRSEKACKHIITIERCFLAAAARLRLFIITSMPSADDDGKTLLPPIAEGKVGAEGSFIKVVRSGVKRKIEEKR